MGRSALGTVLALCILCGCSSSDEKLGKTETPLVVAAVPTVEKPVRQENPGRIRKAMRSMTHTDLIRLFIDEPAPEVSPILEAHQDMTFLSRLSPKEQVLYAELTHQ